MGRAFEFRKERKFKRWGNMARVFTRIGKEITIAAKAGGPDPDNNPRLRTLIQTARSENMPKENIERAIKRAVEHDAGDYEEIVYEGFGPHGIAFLIETATDNNMRTVANIRSYFTKVGGALGTQGCVSFMFDHKSTRMTRTALSIYMVSSSHSEPFRNISRTTASPSYPEVSRGYPTYRSRNSPPRRRKASSSSSTSSRTTTTYRTSTTPWNWLMKNKTTLK